MRMLSRSILLAAALALVGCSRGADDPERTYRRFLDQVRIRNTAGAFELLSPQTQEELTALAKKRSEESGGAVPDDPRALLADAQLARQVESIEVESADSGRAVLRVQSGGAVDRVELERTPEGWRVKLDLSESTGSR